MDHVHSLNYKGSCRKAEKEAVVEVKVWCGYEKTFDWPLLVILWVLLEALWVNVNKCEFINIQKAVPEIWEWWLETFKWTRLQGIMKCGFRGWRHWTNWFVWLTHLYCCMENGGKAFGLQKILPWPLPCTYYSMIRLLNSCCRRYNRSMAYLGYVFHLKLISRTQSKIFLLSMIGLKILSLRYDTMVFSGMLTSGKRRDLDPVARSREV